MLINKMSDDACQWNGHDVVISIGGIFFYRTLCTRLLFVINTLTEWVFLSFCYIYKDFVRQLKAFPPSFCHFCACEMSPGWGHLITWMDPSVGHLNGVLARVRGNLNKKFQKSQMPEGLPGGGMLQLRFDRYISRSFYSKDSSNYKRNTFSYQNVSHISEKYIKFS